MKRRRIAMNIMGFFITGIIALAGIVVPNALLNRQEQSIVGGYTNVAVNERSPMTGDTAADAMDGVADKSPGYEDYIAFANAQRSWSPSIAEPAADELSMEQAVDAARTGLYQLTNLGVLHSAPWDDIPLREAYYTLYSEDASTGYGFWDIRFEDDEDIVYVVLEARTGIIVLVQTTTFTIQGEPAGYEALESYAKYLRIWDATTAELHKDSVNSALEIWIEEIRLLGYFTGDSTIFAFDYLPFSSDLRE